MEGRGEDGRPLTELEIRQHVRMNLFGKSLTAPMRLRLTCDHAARQVRAEFLFGMCGGEKGAA